MKKLGIMAGLAVILAGCAHRPEAASPAPAKHHQVARKTPAATVAEPVARPVVAPTLPPTAQAAPGPTPATAASPTPPKRGALRWFFRDRSTSGGK